MHLSLLSRLQNVHTTLRQIILAPLGIPESESVHALKGAAERL